MAVRALLFFALVGLLACGDATTDSDPDVPVSVGVVAVDEHNLPVVVLEEQGGPRLLPIWIGTAEARSIAAEMEQKPSPRPNTHDLAKRIIQGLDGEIVRVVVSDLRNGTYFATIVMLSRGETVDIDARPSDAIAIALRVDAPIFVRASLLDGDRSAPVGERSERRI
jgi:bifunctional DNase/RNase